MTARGEHEQVEHYCFDCGNEIDPDTCHCGSSASAHGRGDGHCPVPMGCDCQRNDDDVDWKVRAENIRRLFALYRAGIVATDGTRRRTP